MRALTFWKTVVKDEANFLESLIGLLAGHGIRYCLIGGQAVNAYAEPLVSLDLDLVVAAEELERLESLLEASVRIERFPHSINLSMPGSSLRVQIQMDPRYAAFLDRASMREVLGVALPVASPEDVLQGKIWAVVAPEGRPSKQKKDLLDIQRLLEARPELRAEVPAEILQGLL